MTSAAPSSADFDFATREWSEEDIRFVVVSMVDAERPIDGHCRALARVVMDSARAHVNEIQVELGHPDGFDPYVQTLIYARARLDAAREIGQLRDEIAAYTDRLRQASELIDQQHELIEACRRERGM